MRIFKRILDIYSTVIVIAAIIVAILLAGVKAFGISPHVVTSESMDPELRVGSVVYVKEANSKYLEVGDIIVFKLADDLLATHRIVEIIDEYGHLKFRTKGDANKTADASLVDEADVVGIVVFDIPYLGNVKRYMDSGRTRVVGICGALILLMLVTLSEFLGREDV